MNAELQRLYDEDQEDRRRLFASDVGETASVLNWERPPRS